MNGRNGRRFFLAFQWDACSWERTSVWLDVLARRLDGISVHWNLPAFPADMPARRRIALAKPLQARIASAGDIVTSLGYAGACHPLLTLDELEKELAWGVKNSWGSGVADVFGARPALLVPRVPDLGRPGAWKLYADGAFEGIGICVDPVPVGPAPSGCFYCSRVVVPADGPLEGAARTIRRTISSRDGVFAIFDLSSVSDAERMQRVLDELIAPVARGEAAPSHLDPLGTTVKPEPPGIPIAADWRPFLPSSLHEKLDATAAVTRKKRKKTEEYQELLSLLSATTAAGGTAAVPAGSGRGSRLVAHMLGEVALAGSDFDVRLVGGRFTGVVSRGRDLMPRRGAVSYLRIGGRMTQYRTTSSFSFEDDSGTGLREELRLDERGAAVINIEYSFCADCPLLSLGLDVTYPDLPARSTVEEYAPLAIALRDMGRDETAAVEVTAPDDSSSSLAVSEETGAVTCAGSSFRVRRADGGWVLLRFGTVESRRWGLASFRVARVRSGRILEVNPFGSWSPVPGAALSGRRESFALLLGMEGP
jgi:hypothetical protein